jgi:hypothetical protein
MKTTIAIALILTTAAVTGADLKVWHWVRDGETNRMVFTSSGNYQYRTPKEVKTLTPTQRRDFERAIRKAGWVNMTERNERNAARAAADAASKAAADQLRAEREQAVARERAKKELRERLAAPIVEKITRLALRMEQDVEERQELLINGADADEIVNLNLRILNTSNEITRLKRRLLDL